MPSDFRKKLSKPIPLEEIISRVMASCRRQTDLSLVKIWDHWDAVVGSVTAENAQPAAFKGRLLIVHVTGSVWAQQLRFMKEGIIRKINEALGEPLLDDIKFKIGHVAKGRQ